MRKSVTFCLILFEYEACVLNKLAIFEVFFTWEASPYGRAMIS